MKTLGADLTKHVAVLKGGWLTGGRVKSLMSGSACAVALKKAGYQVSEIDVDRSIVSALAEVNPDVVFNALHGDVGRSGAIQGILETLRIPYTHSGILASSLALNKHQAKVMFKAVGIPVTDHVVAHRTEVAARHVMSPPYVVKPLAGESNLGAILIRSEGSPPPQEVLGEEWAEHDELMVERFVPGQSLTCAVMGDVALGVMEINSGAQFSLLTEKRPNGSAKHLLPAPVSPKIYEEVRRMSLKAHAALGCRSVTRVDFRLNDRNRGEGELVCLSVNTQPVLTVTSKVPEIVKASGHSFDELVNWIVGDASCDR